MGRRSRKRSTAPPAPPRAREPVERRPAPAPRTATYKSRREDAPQPAWAPFPLTELCILVAIILLGLGLFAHGERRGVLLGGGVVLVTPSGRGLGGRAPLARGPPPPPPLGGLLALPAPV